MGFSTEDLVQLHQKIRALADAYKPPLKLMGKVDAEYREYMWGRNNSGYYVWLALAVRVLKSKRILELGSYRGASTIMMYSELPPDCEALISVDLERNLGFIPEAMFADPRVRFVTGNDLDLNIYEGRLPEQCDFLFIDTLHERQHLEDEWSIYQHLCASGALVVLDDIRVNDVWKFWESLSYPKIDITADCHPSGFGVFLYLPSTTMQEDKHVSRAYRTALEVAHRRLEESNQALPLLRSSPNPLPHQRICERLSSIARRIKTLINR